MDSAGGLLPLLAVNLHQPVVLAIETVFLGKEDCLPDSQSLVVVFAVNKIVPVVQVEEIISVSKVFSDEVKLGYVVLDHVETGQGDIVSFGDGGCQVVEELERHDQFGDSSLGGVALNLALDD